MATHLDKSSLTANGRGEYESPEVSVILETVRQKFEAELNIYPKAFIVDSHLAMSSEMKVLKTAISDIKASICQVSIGHSSHASKLCTIILGLSSDTKL